MWVAMAELFLLGFGGCQEHSVAMMSSIGSFLKDWTGPLVPLVSPPIGFSLGLSNHGPLLVHTGLLCKSAKRVPSPGARNPVTGGIWLGKQSVGWMSAPTCSLHSLPMQGTLRVPQVGPGSVRNTQSLRFEGMTARDTEMQKARAGLGTDSLDPQHIFPDAGLSGNKTRSCKASRVVHKADRSR